MTNKNCLNIFLTLILLITGAAFASAAQGKKKQLVVINSYNESASWPRKYINTVINEISNRPDFNAVRVIHLNNCLIFNQEEYDSMQEMFFDNYTGQDPDYLVLIGNFAFNLRDKIKEKWGDVPILLICQNSKYAPLDFYFTAQSTDEEFTPPKMIPLETLRDDYNFSIVQTPNKHKETVDMMIEMYPHMKKIVFMGDGLYINRHISYQLKEYINLKYPNVDYEWLMAGDEGVMLPYLNNNDPNVGLLLSTWYYTAPGVTGLPMMSATDSFLINSAHRPVFGLRYAYISFGIIGGVFSDLDEVHDNVKEGLLDLISNKNMRHVPFRIPTEAHPYINYPKLVNLGIPKSICPPDTVYIDKPITFWEAYKSYIINSGIALAVILLCLLFWRVFGKKTPSKQDFNSLVDSMPIGYMQAIIDLDKNGVVKSVYYRSQNKALITLVEDHDLKGLRAEEYPNYWQEAVDALDDMDTPNSSILKTPDEEVYIEFILIRNKKSKENRVMLDVFAIDVTDKMKMEHVLREAANKAVEADNMKSVFLANMSHEIRTPLNAIVGFSNLLCKTTDPEKKKKFVEIIETNNQLLLKLIGDILDISKADSGKMVFNMYQIDVNKLLTTVCAGINTSHKPDVKIVVEFGMESCLITSDPYRVTQVLNNLLTNALKFTERGSITVGYNLMDNKMLRFYVKDTGMGITESDMAKLFTRFTKLNSFIQGTGLGLSISKAIVERLGGTMRAESQGRGKGTTFYFTLPYVLDESKDNYNDQLPSSDEARLEALKQKGRNIPTAVDDRKQNAFGGAADPTLPSYKRERKKILVVEDNESNYQLFVALLSDRFDLVHAKDGDESIRVFARETPDLVLMDINLPIKDGYQACADIRMLSKTVPVVAVTAYAQQSDRHKALNSGFDGYLSKPIEESELISTIRKFI